MPQKYQKAKSSKKYNNKTVRTTAGREVPKIHRKYQKLPNIQRSDKKTKRCKKKGSLTSQKKVSLYQKITNNQVYQIPKMIEFAKITFYNDKKTC